MKVFGLWERLTKIIFFKGKQVAIEPATQSGAADKTISVPDMASNASQEMVLSDQAQTLANKTLTSPVVSGNAVTPGAGKINLSASANQLQIAGENGRLASISTASLSGAKTFVLPDNSGNIVTTGDTGSITSTMIANGTIKNEDISSAPADRIAGSKVSPDFVAQNVVTTGSVIGNSIVVSGSLLGTGAGNALTIGDSDDTITIPGNLTVQGTTTTVDTTNLEVKDKLVTLNNGGLAASGGGTGIEVEENNAVTGYAKVTSDRNGWELKAPNSANVVTIPNSVAAGNVVLDAGTQTIGGSKTFSADLTLSSTGSLKLPVGTEGQRPTAVQGMVRYNTTQNSFEGYDGSTWAGLGGGGTTDRITQANSFNIGDVVYLNGSTYTAAIATAANTAEVAGVVSKIVTLGSVFEITLVGEVTGILAARFDEGTLPATGEAVFLSPTNPGKLTITEPSVVGQVSVPVGIVSGSGSLYVQPKRGVVVGGANLRTQIGLANNTTTNIQNITGYRSGEIAGDVFIDATTDYKFGIKAQFVKDAAGAWKVSFQTWGDTPPQGFKIDVATVASVDYLQVTMPDVAGFNAATSNINFALNAPAVGATLPLQIASTNVSFTDIQAASSAGITFKENDGATTASVNDSGVWSFGIGGNEEHKFKGRAIAIHRGALRNGSLFTGYSGGGYPFISYALAPTTDTHVAEKTTTDNMSLIEFGGSSEFLKFYGFSASNTTIGNINYQLNANLYGYVTNTGSWTLGPSGFLGTHEIRGNVNVKGISLSLGYAGSGTGGLTRYVNDAGNDQWATGILGTVGATSYSFYNTNTATTVGSVNAAGAWTLGPSSGFVGAHALRNAGGANDVLLSLEKYNAISTNSRLVSCFLNSGIRGYIRTNSAATSMEFEAVSDRRIKENIEPLVGSLEKIKALNPVNFNVKGTDGKTDGFIAQEFEQVFPEAVTKTDNGEGNELPEGVSPWSMTQDRLIPHLVKAIQEQQAQIEELKAKLAALENK